MIREEFFGEVKGFVGINDINAEYAINKDNLYMTTKKGEGYNFTYIGTENEIDLTDYSKIKCLVSTGNITEGYSANNFALTLNEKQLPDFLGLGSFVYHSKTLGANQENYNLSFSLPEEYKNGNYYIGVSACLQDVYVYKIWLEK